jgi:hypothetical protein
MPGDECETWTREQLLKMNARFIDRLEQAFEPGLESRASASCRQPSLAAALSCKPSASTNIRPAATSLIRLFVHYRKIQIGIGKNCLSGFAGKDNFHWGLDRAKG